MMYDIIYWLNAIPSLDNVFEIQSPSTIVTGRVPDYNTHCSLEFGTHCQVYTGTNNTMVPQTGGGAGLRLTGNEQGGYYFFSLDTGRCMVANS